MRKLITALVATATVIAGSLVGTATATTVAGVESLPSLTKNSSPVANVALWRLGFRLVAETTTRVIGLSPRRFLER